MSPWRSFSGAHPNSGSGANSFHGGHHGHHTQWLFFIGTSPFFYSPFFYPSYPWWGGYYPPMMFSDFGCPYEDYNYQQQPNYYQSQPNYYQPEEDTREQGREAEQPSESAAETPSVPSEQPQVESAPFTYETPLPDVIEWGKASTAAPERQPAPSGKGPLIVNLPHHTLTILPDANSLTTSTGRPAPPDSH